MFLSGVCGGDGECGGKGARLRVYVCVHTWVLVGMLVRRSVGVLMRWSACVCACVRAFVSVCACARGRMCMCHLSAHACLRA